MAAAEFRVLGAVEAFDDGRPVDLGHSRQRGVLAVLLIQANRPVPVEQFLDHVWGEHLPQRGRDALYSYLSRLRVILAGVPGVSIQRRSTGYVLTVDEASVDLHRFRQLIGQARARDDSTEALALFGRALGLWRGTAFADLDSPWFASVRTAIEAERRAAQLDRTDAALRCGHHADLLADLATQAEHHPLDERLAGQTMLALYRSGRQADALEHYQDLRKELAEQLGTDPGPSLRELYQQILTADPALAAPAHAPSGGSAHVTPRQLPPAPAGFTGRNSELTALTAALDSATSNTNTVLVSALAGAGGIGKTWLALHWAHQYADRFPDGQLFVDLRGFSPDGDPLEPLTAVRGFLDALGVAPAQISGGLDEHTARYRSQIADKRMLILLDNAATAEQVTPLLPGTPSCAAVVTSRKTLTPLLTRHGARHLNLDVLTDAEAHALLAGRLGHARVAAEPRAVTELIELCGRYPLALSVMASRAHAYPHVPLADLTSELREAGLDALGGSDPTTSLPAVLSWSLRGLTDHQRTVFALLGIVSGPDIGLPAAASLTGLSQPEARAVLRELVDASLLHRNAGDRYAMHDLIRAYAATTADSLADDVREAALRRVLDHYTHTAYAADRLLQPNRVPIQLGQPVTGAGPRSLPDTPAAVAWLDTEYRALLSAQHTAAAQNRHRIVWELAWALFTFQANRGDRHDRLAMWLLALDAAAHLSDPAIHIDVHRNLGSNYVLLERYDDALGHLHQALALSDEHHDSLQQARIYRVLAGVWERRGDYRQALGYVGHSVRLFRALDLPMVEAEALNAMGWCAAQLGEYDDAREHCRTALALFRDHHDSFGESITLDSLGYIAHQSGDHQQATSDYQQALAMFRAAGNTYESAGTLDRLGQAHAALGHREQARTAWREALELYRQQDRGQDADQLQRQLDDLDRSDTDETDKSAS